MASFDPYKAPSAPLDVAVPSSSSAACPKCGATAASKVGFTWWGGALGPRLFHVVKCGQCRTQFNGRTGGTMGKVILIYQLVALAIFGGIIALGLMARR